MSNILITGHPRSGTMYIKFLLSKLGHNCLFERYNSNGFTASWKHGFEGIFEGRETEEHNIKCDFDKIIHQVRHPLKVIASATTLYDSSFEYIKKFVRLPDKLKHKNQTIKNCMQSWLVWNMEIENKANWRYKIEDLPNILPEWCKQLEIPKVTELPKIGKVNKRPHLVLSWDDLFSEDKKLAFRILNLAQKYGYKK